MRSLRPLLLRWNARQERCRIEYRDHPIVSPGAVTDAPAIRAWAHDHGHNIGNHRHIPAAIVDAWVDAHRRRP